MQHEIDIKFSDDDNDDNDDDDDDENDKINKEMERIKTKKKIYKTLWSLFTFSNKSLMVINFSTILFSIFNPQSNIPLILSIFTLSFSVICDTRIYENILGKLIDIYEDEIGLEIDRYVRDYHKTGKIGRREEEDPIYEIQQIEKKYLANHLGQSFTVPTTLRSIDWKRFFMIFCVYIFSFISIILLCYYKSSF